MANYRVFSALNTKLLAMQSKLLQEEEYIRLIGLPDLESQIHFLNTQTHYRGALNAASYTDDVELGMERKRYADLLRLRYYLRGPYLRFFDANLLRFEVEEIKVILRGIRSEEDMDILMLQSILLGHYTDRHPIYRFDKNTTLPQYIENLKETPYYEVLESYADDESPRTLFYMEMLLDRYYYKQLLETAKGLTKEDRNFVRESLGTDIDLKNLEFIYRGKKFYDLIPQELVNLAIPEGLYIDADEIQRLSGGTVEEFEAEVAKTKMSFMVDGGKDIDLEMFRAMKRYQYGQFKRYEHTTEKNIMLLLAYIHLTEFEIRDVIAILEGRRYNMDKREINRFLIKQVDEAKL